MRSKIQNKNRLQMAWCFFIHHCKTFFTLHSVPKFIPLNLEPVLCPPHNPAVPIGPVNRNTAEMFTLESREDRPKSNSARNSKLGETQKTHIVWIIPPPDRLQRRLCFTTGWLHRWRHYSNAAGVAGRSLLHRSNSAVGSEPCSPCPQSLCVTHPSLSDTCL